MSEGSITFCPRCTKPVSQPAHRLLDAPGRPIHVATGKEDC